MSPAAGAEPGPAAGDVWCPGTREGTGRCQPAILLLVKSPSVARPDPGLCVPAPAPLPPRLPAAAALAPVPPAALTEAEEDEELEADEFVPVHLERVQVQDELLRPQHQRVQDGAGLGRDGRHVHLPGQGWHQLGQPVPSPTTACCRAPHSQVQP